MGTRIQEFQENAQKTLQQREQDLLKPIIDRAKKAISDVASENGYTYILDSGTAAVLYSQDSDDIMPLVKGSNKELGDNVVLEINASPGTDGITDVLGHNFINILLSNLTKPSEFFIQRKQAGFLEAIDIWFNDKVHKEFLAKLDTGNGTQATTVEVGKLEIGEKTAKFTIDGQEVEMEVTGKMTAITGSVKNDRNIVIAPLVRIGLRQMSNVPIALVESREKSTNVLVNRDLLSRLGYVVVSDEAHILTPEMEKVNIV
jgi:hypothetical protein